ncbi:lipid kinase [Pseudomonas sp. Q2-TVG4-2]|uniref:lipid kinase n=1 Tax=Pseudomonas sp. Q2-TVG4-2 TaxID=1685699 RepID=UPI0015E721A2|nr:lipid kinase [Pseudomonas sp. Q2-TVG4-2]
MPTDETRRALLVINRHARNGSGLIDDVLDTLREGGIELVRPSNPDAPVAEQIAQSADGCDLVIIGGGDGTLNAAAPALIMAGLPVGILPLGTANDLAKTLGIPPNPVAAALLIVSGTPHPMDVGVVNGHIFLNVASIGFSSELARQLSAEAKKKWGRLGYAITAFRLLRRLRRFVLYIEHDGERMMVKTIQASVGNGRYYGGGMTVEQTATADDGHLDFYSLEIRRWWKLLLLFPRLRRGTHGATRDVRAFRTTAITLSTRKPMPINTDGELTTHTPAEFSIKPKALSVYSPER